MRPSDARIGVLSTDLRALRVRVATLTDAARAQALSEDDLSTLPWPESGGEALEWTLPLGDSQRVLDLMASAFAGEGK